MPHSLKGLFLFFYIINSSAQSLQCDVCDTMRARQTKRWHFKKKLPKNVHGSLFHILLFPSRVKWFMHLSKWLGLGRKEIQCTQQQGSSVHVFEAGPGVLASSIQCYPRIGFSRFKLLLQDSKGQIQFSSLGLFLTKIQCAKFVYLGLSLSRLSTNTAIIKGLAQQAPLAILCGPAHNCFLVCFVTKHSATDGIYRINAK